jgi:peptidoglycan hydrolase-like protein with peptidoglycan-binding domain
MNSDGAGLYGPKTRDKLNEILASREYNKVLIAEANIDTIMIASADTELIDDALAARKVLSSELGFGAISPDVVVLQEFLRAEGYLDSTVLTNYYGPVTRQSVIHFQLANNIILTEDDIGAGRIGPATLKYINSLI